MSSAMERRAARRLAAAARAREIAANYTPTPCNCAGCSPMRHARIDFTRIAREANDSNGMTETDIWIAWREANRAR